MAGFREFLRTQGGIYVAAILLVVGVIAIYFATRTSPAVAENNSRWFVDATNGQGFKHSISVGESYPIAGPSGQKTAYPAELCYWTADGHVKSEPTPVLLNQAVGKTGPTFCPDCHRLVVGHNPMAVEGQTPPPTEDEYNKRKGAADDQGGR